MSATVCPRKDTNRYTAFFTVWRLGLILLISIPLSIKHAGNPFCRNVCLTLIDDGIPSLCTLGRPQKRDILGPTG